jgi:5-methylcytosine-specific restriction endonuclease McrA
MRAIVLNADYSFLSITPSLFDSVRLMAKGCITPLSIYERRARSERQEFEVPAVAMLKKYVTVRRRRHGFTQASHQNVFVRDGERCAYCGAKLTLRTTTKDHVVPRSKGGPDTLLNVVAACRTCNGLKADRTLRDSGMQLRPSVELRQLTNDEKLSVLLKTGAGSTERRAWIGFLKESGISLF